MPPFCFLLSQDSQHDEYRFLTGAANPIRSLEWFTMAAKYRVELKDTRLENVILHSNHLVKPKQKKL